MSQEINLAKTRKFLTNLHMVKELLTEDDVAELSSILYRIVDRLEKESY